MDKLDLTLHNYIMYLPHKHNVIIKYNMKITNNNNIISITFC